MTRRTSVVDVAKLAKLSTATVSRAMNNLDDVMPETRTRVMQAAEKLGYRPNLQARALRRGMNEVIGLLLSPNLVAIEDSTFIANLLHHLIARAAQEGYGVIPEMLSPEADGSLRTPRIIGEFNVAGVLSVGFMERRLVEEIFRFGKTTCLVGDYDWTSADTLSVDFDFKAGMHEAIRYLAALGHQQIAFIYGNAEYPANVGKLSGFKESMHELGLEADERLLITVPDDQQNFSGGKRITHELLKLKNSPTAICFANDWFAVGGLCAAAEAGVKVPDDISLVGFDNSYLARQSSPRITSISLDFQAMADALVNNLVRSIRRQSVVTPKVRLRPSLVINETCAPNRQP